MTTLQSVKKKLEPLGVYNIAEGTNIYAELAAYCEALDRHRTNLDTVLRECFISTAESYGIELREKILGNLRSEYSLDERREMLRLRRGFGEGDFTVAGFDKLMRALGVNNYTLNEMYSDYTISVTMNNSIDETDANWVENQIKLFSPAHLIADVHFGGPSFAQLDSENLPFSGYDGRDRTWIQIENL